MNTRAMDGPFLPAGFAFRVKDEAAGRMVSLCGGWNCAIDAARPPRNAIRNAIRGLGPNYLEVGAAGGAREGDDVADVPHPRQEQEYPLQAQAEAGVRHRAVTPQVEI